MRIWAAAVLALLILKFASCTETLESTTTADRAASAAPAPGSRRG